MRQLKLKIPADFIIARASLSWREVRFGIENELLDPRAPIELAVVQVSSMGEAPTILLDLVGSAAGESIKELLDRLAEAEAERSLKDVSAKWLFIVLAWIYERRDELLDPLQRAEEVYADFGYPERMAGFIRYMPMIGSDLGSRESNERRLLDRWRRYLEEAAQEYAPKSR